MEQIIGILLLLIASAIGFLKNKYYQIITYVSCAILGIGIFLPSTKMIFGIFQLQFTAKISFICFVITLLLLIISYLEHKLTNLLTLLNVFICAMSIATSSSNLWTFYIALELIGILSTIFVAIEQNTSKSSQVVYIYNKFASLIFLIGCLNQHNELGVWCLLMGCLCKSAQFPFSYCLFCATDAHIIASILIHCATVLGIGIIFISKFYTIFDYYPQTYIVMGAIGLFTAIIMPIIALFQTNIKKFIACLSISSAGIMFLCCGIKQFDLSLLYFICHAFFKSALFTIFFYTIINSRNPLS